MPFISHTEIRPPVLKDRGRQYFPEDAVGLHYKTWQRMAIRKGYWAAIGERHAFLKQSLKLTTRHAWLHALTEFDVWSGRFEPRDEVFHTCEEYLDRFFTCPEGIRS